MRLIILSLVALLLLIQYPLWLGKGGWLRVWDLDQQVVAARKKNDELRARNAKLDSEVQDLKDGTGAIEERARLELGMIRQDEIFELDRQQHQPGQHEQAQRAPGRQQAHACFERGQQRPARQAGGQPCADVPAPFLEQQEQGGQVHQRR